MSDDDGVLALDEIRIPGIDEHPPTESVLLHGPPGTGKTTTAAARIALLIRDHGYSIHDVSWATYRRALADDTLARLAAWGVIDESELDNAGSGATRYISTIHAIANRVATGLSQPIEPWHRSEFCNKVGIRYSTKEPWDKSPGKELFRCFEWMSENCYDPGDPADLAAYPDLDTLREQFGGDVGDMWRAWGRYKEGEDRIDFHEMLEAALEQKAAPDAPILVIDEYHDSTPLMARVAELWMQRAEIVIVAGDPHQVVNAYQGASPYFFERLETRYPKILLDKSYRVGSRHWNAATALLSRAHSPPPVETTGTGEIREYRSGRFEHSSDTGWLTPSETQPGSPAALVVENSADIMFLTRTRRQADGVGATLEKAGILYRSQSELGGWDTERGETRLNLYNALTKIRGVSPSDFDSSTTGLDRFGADSSSVDRIYLSAGETAALLAHASATHLAQSRSDTAEYCSAVVSAEKAQSLVKISEYVEPSFWGTYTHGAASERKLNKGRRSDRERRALRSALQRHDAPVRPSEIGVSVMTIHASKGQEATDVVVYDGITHTVREGMRIDEETRKNEWRTWYVALTRASERLHVMRGGFGWCDSIIPQDIRRMAMSGQADNALEIGADAGGDDRV